MTRLLFATCVLFAATCHLSVSADELTLGSKAPKLELKKFIKGEEVKGFEKGKIYVVELWATWCGPCRATIPHLTELQKKYEDVTIIGVAVLEQDQSAVPDFVEEMGKKMDYRVALDLVDEDGEPGEGKTVKNWMEPAGMGGIPGAFIVNGEGKIAWIGHPAAMDVPLDQIVAGTWDLAAEAKKIELQNLLQKLFAKFQDDNDPDELLVALDSAVKTLPDRAIQFQMVRFQILSLSKGRGDESVEAADLLLQSEKADDDFNFLNNIAWTIVDPARAVKADSRLIKLALKISIKADNLTNNREPSVADTLAKAYFDNGDLANAVKTQERVIELAEGTPLAKSPGLKRRLRQYKKALEAADKSAEKTEAETKVPSN